jgi:hypothetical protein
MDINKCREIKALLEVALKDLVPNCTISIGRIKYGTAGCDLKLEVTEHINGIAESKQRIDWKRCVAGGAISNLKVEWLGQRVRHEGNIYIIQGFLPRRRKYPVVATKNGKEFIYTTRFINKIYTEGKFIK